MNKQIKNILIVCLIFAFTIMPAMAADGDGEGNVKLIPSDGSEGNRNFLEKSDNDHNGQTVGDTSGWERLFMSPIDGVKSLYTVDPIGTAITMLVGCFMGGAFILTVLELSSSKSKMSLGNMLGKDHWVIKGRNGLIVGLGGFLFFLLFIAVLKQIGTSSIF